MGIFGSFSTIGKIYKKLNQIEEDMGQMQKYVHSQNHPHLFNQASAAGLNHLKELMSMVEQGGATVQNADYTFAGHTARIDKHMFVISEYMKRMMVEYNRCH